MSSATMHIRQDSTNMPKGQATVSVIGFHRSELASAGRHSGSSLVRLHAYRRRAARTVDKQGRTHDASLIPLLLWKE